MEKKLRKDHKLSRQGRRSKLQSLSIGNELFHSSGWNPSLHVDLNLSTGSTNVKPPDVTSCYRPFGAHTPEVYVSQIITPAGKDMALSLVDKGGEPTRRLSVMNRPMWTVRLSTHTQRDSPSHLRSTHPALTMKACAQKTPAQLLFIVYEWLGKNHNIHS